MPQRRAPRLPREARKRGGKAKKPGLSDEQTPLLIARDRHGDQVDAVLPNRTAEAVGVALDGVLARDDVLLCVDGDAAVIAYAKKHGIEFETIIASKGEHVHEKVLHLQNVNATVSRFKTWLTRLMASPANTCRITSPGEGGWRPGKSPSPQCLAEYNV